MRRQRPDERYDDFFAEARQKYEDGDRTCIFPGCPETGVVMRYTTYGELPVCSAHGRTGSHREMTDEDQHGKG